MSTKAVMRCLKRYGAREVYEILINQPADVVTGDQIRGLRTARKLSLTVVARQFSTCATQISRLERGVQQHQTTRRRPRLAPPS